MLSTLVNGFPLWALLASLLALYEPAFFTWFTGPFITFGLGIIMIGMGITLEFDDFRRISTNPSAVLLGLAVQYSIMPLLGWSIGLVFELPAPFAAGLILVACCPGGTASNVVTYLARADLPLSVTMTACSTLVAAAVTPVLTTLLVGSRVDVSATGLFLSTVQVVILPVLMGLSIRRFAPRLSTAVLEVAPLIAVITIVLIVASIIGEGRDDILSSGLRLVGAVFVLHSGGFLVGYGAGRLVTRDQQTARTLSIEVGMQNSGLGVVLARQNFASPLVAIPSAISSLFHSLIASALAGFWRRSLVVTRPQ
jgi:BASS family bile acid:Na+ symporter